MIDFVLVNSLAFDILCDEIVIDEQQEKIDLTDHDLIIIIDNNIIIEQHRSKLLEKRKKLGIENVL